MVKVTIAGGTGAVAREVIDALVASQRHEVLVLTRSKTPVEPPFPGGVTTCLVDYDSPTSLQESLAETHTLLSFIQLLAETGKTAQENLIGAAVAVGVKRIAPSECGSSAFTNMPFYQNKQAHRDQLEQLSLSHNFQYSLFQPGLFLEYLAAPHKTTAHLSPLTTVFDFAGRRAMVVDGHEAAVLTLTRVTDFAAAVAGMVDLPDDVVWPKNGGICGNKLTVQEVVDMGGRVFGRPLAVTKLQIVDLEAGHLTSPWGLTLRHKAVAADQATWLLKQVAIGTLLGITKGAWSTSDEVNKLLPGDFQFTDAEAFLIQVWRD